MKQLLVLSAIVLAIRSLPLVEDSHGPSQYRFQGVLQEAFNSSGSSHHRSIRANTDNLKIPLERLQRIARITNGIHLLKELIAGTIPAEELVSELLFFGPVKLSEITELDENVITAAIDTLKNLPNSLDPDNKASKAEKTFDEIKNILDKVDGIGNLKEWKGKEHFKKEIDRLATDGIKTKFINKLSSSTSAWINQYGVIKTDGTNAESKTFARIVDALNDLKEAIGDFGISETHWKFNKFETLMDGLSPVSDATEGVEIFKIKYVDLEVKDEYGTDYSSYLDEVSSKISSIIKANPPLQAIRKLIVSKETKSHQRTLRHTHGLPQGVIDVKEATYDIGDPWIRKIVTTDELKVAFRKLEELETLLSKPDNSLDFKKQGVTLIDGLLENVVSVSDIFASIGNMKTGLSQTSKCERPILQDIQSAQFDELKQNLTEIDKRLKQFNDETQKLSPHLKDKGLLGMCDEVIQICAEAQKAGDIQEVVKKFKSYEKLNKLEGIFKKLHIISSNIGGIDLDQVKTDADNVIANFGVLESYLSTLKPYSEYFNCLQTQNEMRLFFKKVSAIKKIRKFKSDDSYMSSLNNGLGVVKKVTGVKEDLEKLKTTIGNMKGINSSEINELIVFKKSGDLSKVIGEAVQGVANMKNALDKKVETFDKVLNNIQFVKNNQKLITDPTDVKNLQDLIGLEPSIQSMYSTLDTFIGGVKDNDSPVLKNHSGLFKSAKLVSGVSGDFLAMIPSVEHLKKKIPGSNELEELQTSLKAMQTMGLDFAKYQTSFDNSDSSLENLDVAFANYNKRMSRKAPSLSTPQQQGIPSGSQGSGNNQSEKKDDNTTPVILIAGSVVLAVLGTLSVPGYIFVWTPWKRMRNTRKFLDKLMDDLYIRYSSLYVGKYSTKKELVDECFSDAYLCDIRCNKENLCIKTDPCKKEECCWNEKMIKATAMVLKGHGNMFKSDHYHAVLFPISKKKKVIVSHFPTKLSGNTPETIAKFFWMAKQYRSETIVSLESFGTVGKIKNPNGTPSEKEAKEAAEGKKEAEDLVLERYIPEKKGASLPFENVIITCLELEVISDKKKYPKLEGVIEKRKLKVEIENQTPFTVRHIWYTGWKYGAYDEKVDTFNLVYILNMIENDKTPPIIASYGLGKSAVFAFVLFARFLMLNDPKTTVTTVMQRSSEYMSNFLPNYQIYKASIILLYEFLIQDGKVKVKNETKERYELFKNPTDELALPAKKKDPLKNDEPAKTEDPAKSEFPAKSEVPSKSEVAPKK